MKVAFELRALQNDPVGVTEKVATLSKTMNEMGFQIDHVEIAVEDRTADFDLYRLMSVYNSAERLASKVVKKVEDTLAGSIDKI